jgi:uncharacterized repeat protein (TIGR01451 family)
LTISLLLIGTIQAANLKVIVKYGKTGGIAGALNTTADKVNGVDICPSDPTAGCDFSYDAAWSDAGTPNDGGDDTHTGDLLVRTNDIFEAVAAWSWNGTIGAGEDTLTIKSTLPAGYRWDNLPGSCESTLSSISGQDIICVRKDVDKNSVGTVSEDLTFPVRVLGSTASGTEPGDISFEISGENATTSTDNAGVSLTVTAAPRWNLQKSRYTFSTGYTHNGVLGYRIYYKYYIEVDEVNGEIDSAPGYLGVESMGAAATFTFTDDLSDVSPNAELIECKADTWSNSSDPYPYHLASSPEKSVATAKDVQAITCNQTGSNIAVSISGIDARLDHIPTKSKTGSNLPVNRAIAAIGIIQVFVPLQDVKNGIDGIEGNADDGSLQTVNRLINFDPTAPSGNSNFGTNSESEKDNSYTYTLYAARGSFDKGYTTKHGLHIYTEGGSSWWRTGDGLLTANAEFASRLSYSNSGGTGLTGVQMCDVIDANRMEIIDVVNKVRSHSSGPFDYYANGFDADNLEFEYASTYEDDSWLASNGGDLTISHGAKVAAECSAGTWYTTPAEARATGLKTITKVRIKIKDGVAIKPGENMYVWLKHKVRATKLDGTPLENGDEIVNYGSVIGNEYYTTWSKPTYIPNAYPNPANKWNGDRVTFSGGKVRLIKTIDRNSFEPGSIATFTLDSSYTNDTGTAETTTVTLTDMLPNGLKYVTSSTQNASEPTIGTCVDVADIGEVCTASNQVLIWNLGTKTANAEIADISYQALVEATAPQGTVTNFAIVSAPADASAASQRKSEVNLNITIPATINLSKNVVNQTPQERDGDPIDFEVNARNGSAVTVTALDIIDILPFNGDGVTGAIKFRDLTLQRNPATAYHGIRSFERMELIAHPQSPGTCDLTPGITYYYTKESSTTVNMSPKDTSNDNPGTMGSKWCLGDINGPASGCGFTKAEVTAIRASGPSMGEDGVCQLKIKMSVSGNLPDDIYNNSSGASTIGVTLPVLSNAATVVIVKSSIGNYVWLDANADGIQDVNEVGINDVSVELYQGSSLKETTTTANDSDGKAGFYQFKPLESGEFTIKVTPPAGYNISPKDVGGDDTKDSDINSQGNTDTITLAAASEDLKYDAGLYKPSSIGDTIWYDSDRDGLQDAGEDCRGLNIAVKLLDVNGAELNTTTTNNCKYLFDNLNQGSYKVKFELPAGHEASAKTQGGDTAKDSDADTATLTSDVIVLANGNDIIDIDFGYFTKTSLGNFVWIDTNANGIQDAGEVGLDGVTVELLDSANTIKETKTTANGGLYLFENLVAGDYKVRFTMPSGYTLSPENKGGDDEKDSDVPASLTTPTITLTAAQEDIRWDMGVYKVASLGDKVWVDTNGNGTQDAGEDCNGLNVVVTLLDSNISQTTANCAYKFEGLKPDTYRVKFTLPSGYTATTKNVGTNETDSDIDTAGFTKAYTLKSGDNITEVDAGLLQDASLGNFVWLDANANGIQDADETGIKDVVVTLLNADGSETGKTTITDINGIYAFTALKPNGYKVKIVLPAGYKVTVRDAGVEDKDSDIDVTSLTTDTFTLSSGIAEPRVDIGLYTLTELGDRVWLDTNADGIQDANEVGVPNVTVSLLKEDSTPTGKSMKTDASGNYLFTGLKPDNYKVGFIIPEGYQVTTQDKTDDDKDSDVNIDTNATDTIIIESGEKDKTVDLGLIALKNISGHVRVDINDDDKADRALENVEIKLNTCTSSMNLTARTNDKGFYEFTGLVPNCYIVTEIDPEGYTSVNDVDGENDNNISVKLTVTDKTDLDFLDEPLLKISGHVRADMDFDGDVEVDSSKDKVLKNVEVTLFKNDDKLLTIKTDESGFYQFSDVTPGIYKIEESDPKGFDSLRDIDGANDNNITVTVVEADIIDRDFDDQKTILVSGTVRVDIDGDRKVDEPLKNTQLLLCEKGATCTIDENKATTYTDDKGTYQFYGLKPGNYIIVEIDKPGYESLNDIDGGDKNVISVDLDGSGDVVEQDFEDLAVAPMFIIIQKSVTKKQVSIGGFVPYSITVENLNETFNYASVKIKDILPAGFKYEKNSAYLARGDKKAKIKATGTNIVEFGEFALKTKEKVTLSYLLKVGVAVAKGEHTNRAVAIQNNEEVSNTSIVAVAVIADPFIDNSVVVGKVFEDNNENGIQDEKERGIAGVRLATVEGMLIETDGFGRYHVADAKSGGFTSRGSNFIIKVDDTTLPEGAIFTTENPRVYRITSGQLNVINFGVKLPKYKRLTAEKTITKVTMKKEFIEVKKQISIGSIYFDSDQDCIRPDQVKELKKIVEKIKEHKNGSIMIEGNTDARAPIWYNKKLAYKRAESVYNELKNQLGDSLIDKVEVIYSNCDKEVKFDPRYDWWGKPNAPKTKKECTELGNKKDCKTGLNSLKGGAL